MSSMSKVIDDGLVVMNYSKIIDLYVQNCIYSLYMLCIAKHSIYTPGVSFVLIAHIYILDKSLMNYH